MLSFGAHVSAAGGVDRAVGRAFDLDMTCLQLFTKNERQWAAKPLDPLVVERFRSEQERTALTQIVAHDSYLINIASPDDTMWGKSRLALTEELDRCDVLGIKYLVSHPGAHLGSGESAGIRRVAEAINRIHGERPHGKAVILLETTAGQGTCMGRSFEELGGMLELIEDQERAGVCLDTCHVFAAGYDLRTEEGYASTMTAFGQHVGFDRLHCVHLNDSKKPLGSRADRHEHIGEGELGRTAFEFIVNDERFAGLPGILETPKGDDGAEDRVNLATLRGLVKVAA